jgi:hypothetical protein
VLTAIWTAIDDGASQSEAAANAALAIATS